MLRIKSLRLRIAAAYIVGTLGVAGLVAGSTYYLVVRTLTRDRETTAVRQTYTRFRALREFLASAPKPGGYSTDVVETQLQSRGVDVVVISGGIVAASSDTVGASSVPRELRQSVQGGHVAYEIVPGQPRMMIVGSPVPGVPNHEAYFFYPLSQVDRIIGLLRRIFAVVVAIAALVAGAVGFQLAGRTIRPLRAAAEAARRVAAGDLGARVAETSDDELGQLARAFNHMTDALVERIERERRFVADASHELRTPLTALKTSIDYLADRMDELPPRLRGPMALAAEELRSFQRLVDDLLELTRVESGAISPSWEDVDLTAFASEIARHRAPGTPVEIEGPEHLVVRTDKMRLERVVGNLLENAVFHGGGREVRIRLEAEDGWARITVADRGPGIDPDQLPRIFERFWRGDSARRRDGRVGAGLGLAIARENAAVIGADIGVASEPGHGTRFEVKLPRDAG